MSSRRARATTGASGSSSTAAGCGRRSRSLAGSWKGARRCCGTEPGQESELTLSVSRDGRPVTDLQPYLGAYGHLVVLRDGDLAYLHAHPVDEADGASAPLLVDVGYDRSEVTKRRPDGSEYKSTRSVRIARVTGEEI